MAKAKAITNSQSLICDRCERGICGPESPATFYVHLQGGEIVSVPDVTGLTVTDTSIVLQRAAKAPISYPRSEIYYACCDKDMAPPQC